MNPYAKLALEWFYASGERTEARLYDLVKHYTTTYAITDPETVEAIYQEALADFKPL